MKMCFTPLIVGEIKKKFAPRRMTVTKEQTDKNNIVSIPADVEKLEHSCIVCGM